MSREHKPVFLCDVDGVVADFVPHLIHCAELTIDPEGVTQFDLGCMAESETETESIYCTMSNPYFWKTIPLKEGAQDGIERVLAKGYHVVRCTTPWLHCETWTDVRRRWLAEHFPHVPAAVYTEHKQFVSGDILLDDRLKIVQNWRKHHPQGKAIVFDAPYNRCEGMIRVASWDEVVDLI